MKKRGTPTDLPTSSTLPARPASPKGVMVTHRNLVNAYFGWLRAYRLDDVRSHLQMASFAFDVFGGDMVRALGSGGKLVIARETLLDPLRLLD